MSVLFSQLLSAALKWPKNIVCLFVFAYCHINLIFNYLNNMFHHPSNTFLHLHDICTFLMWVS